MALRKVLLLTYHFPPSGAVAVHRMLGLVRYLPKFGWQPIVVAPPRVPWEPEDTSLLAQVPASTPVERVPFASGFLGKIGRYFAPESNWLWQARPTCERTIHEHRPSAIITSSPPGCVHLLGRRLHRRHGLPWLADFRDPWITNNPTSPWAFSSQFARWQERKVMRDANVLIANTPLNARGWAQAYPDAAKKIETITNGFDPERFVSQADPPPEAPRLTILHAGELYAGRDPRPFLDALEQMPNERKNLRLQFLGRKTEQVVDLPTEILRRDLSNCVTLLHDQVPYALAIQEMSRADILLLIHSPGLQVSVPAKLYEYLGAGRPILALAELDSDIAWVLRESGVRHRIAPPLDVRAIKQALIELVQEAQKEGTGTPDRRALQQFTRERMAQRFADCLDRCVETP
jgi:glycosyltransferase involved in cell wall biosynthesis